MIHQLPRNWAGTTLGQVVAINPRQLDHHPADDDLVSFIPMAMVEEESGKLDASTTKLWKEVSQGYTRFQENDVLFAKITPCMENGKYALARGLLNGKGAGSTEFHVLRSSPAIDSRFLLFFLFQSDLRRAARLSMRGAAGQLRVPPGFFEDLAINVPPIAEQHHIVAEIEKQFTRLDDAVAALKRVQANLKRYRASVLKAACEGRLVPTEAELARKEGRDYEPASELLKRILAERRAKWEADQLQKMIAAGKPPKNDEWKKKYNEPEVPDPSIRPKLPDGWTWASLDQLSLKITDGEHLSPTIATSGVYLLSAKDVRENGVIFDDPKFVSDEDATRFRQRCDPGCGDILIVSRGATIGRVCVVNTRVLFCLMGSVILVRPHPLINPDFVSAWLTSPDAQRAALALSGSTAQQAIYIRDIRGLPIPLPPRHEQERITAEADRRLSTLEHTEKLVKIQLSIASSLRRALLKTAFEGKLVPQDPNDEPASVLLERIRAERAAYAANGNNSKGITKAGNTNTQRRRRGEKLAQRVSAGKD